MKSIAEILAQGYEGRKKYLEQPYGLSNALPAIGQTAIAGMGVLQEQQKKQSILQAQQDYAQFLSLSPEDRSKPENAQKGYIAAMNLGINPTPAPSVKTPQQIEAESAARARGTQSVRPSDTVFTPEAIDSWAKKIQSGKAVLSDLPGGMSAKSLRAQVAAKLGTSDYNVGEAVAKRRFQTGQAAFASSSQVEGPLTYMKSVIPNLDRLQTLSDKLPKGQFPIINRATLRVMQESGNPDVVAYATAMTETADQVAKILQGGGTGGGTSDSKMKQALELFDKGFSPAQMKAVTSEVKGLLSNRMKAMESVQSKYAGKQTAGPETPKSSGDPLQDAINAL